MTTCNKFKHKDRSVRFLIPTTFLRSLSSKRIEYSDNNSIPGLNNNGVYIYIGLYRYIYNYIIHDNSVPALSNRVILMLFNCVDCALLVRNCYHSAPPQPSSSQILCLCQILSHEHLGTVSAVKCVVKLRQTPFGSVPRLT